MLVSVGLFFAIDAMSTLSLNPWIGRSSDRRVNSENAF